MLTGTLAIQHLREQLRGALPGLSAQMDMAPQPRPGTERILDPHLDCRRAGVLVLLYPCGAAPGHAAAPDGLCLVLTRRTETVNSHQGQISFPGGSMEPGETPIAAALREAVEELAIDPSRLEVLGRLSPLYVPPSGFCVYPVVAYTSERPAFIPEKEEVAEVLEVSVAHLLAPGTRRMETRQVRGQQVQVPFYDVAGQKVWGATAMMLCELLSLLATERSAP